MAEFSLGEHGRTGKKLNMDQASNMWAYYNTFDVVYYILYIYTYIHIYVNIFIHTVYTYIGYHTIWLMNDDLLGQFSN